MTEEKKFKADSVEGIIDEIVTFVCETPLNIMPGEKRRKLKIFDDPLVKFADGDDPYFVELKTVIAPFHMTPREALAAATGKSPEELPDRLSVISWVLPITAKTRKSNKKEKLVPSRWWSHTRWFGEQVNETLRTHMVDRLHEMGYLAVAPATSPYLKLDSNEKGPYSNWSERHIAFGAGQGAFGLSDGFITEKGIAHRVGSVVTDLPLPPSPRYAESPYANCLYHFDEGCGKCIKRCPAGAISKEGHDKLKCSAYLNEIGYTKTIQNGYDLETSVAGCGLCQTGVPCEHHIPSRIQKSREEKP